jgi:hypothetical protein
MENLNQYGLESELEDLGGSFTPEQREIFVKFANYIESYKDDDEQKL